ncbi:MAG: hypothetical protein RI883_1068 [Bacteroidota bacterium]|jgi:hypothetical protein
MHITLLSRVKMYADYAEKILSICYKSSVKLKKFNFWKHFLTAIRYTYYEASMSQKRQIL